MINIPNQLTDEQLALIPVDQDKVRNLAYLLWEREGYQPSDGVDYWIEAERRLRQEIAVMRFVPKTLVPQSQVSAAQIIQTVRDDITSLSDGMEQYNQQLRKASSIDMIHDEPEDFPVFDDRKFLTGNQIKDLKNSVKISAARAIEELSTVTA